MSTTCLCLHHLSLKVCYAFLCLLFLVAAGSLGLTTEQIGAFRLAVRVVLGLDISEAAPEVVDAVPLLGDPLLVLDAFATLSGGSPRPLW